MAEDNALRLICKIVYGKDIAPVFERGITADWFPVEEHRALFRFITDFYGRYDAVPTRATVLDNYPTARIFAVEDSIEYLLDQMVAWRRQQQTIAAVRDVVDAIADGDHEGAITAMSRGLLTLDTDLTAKATDRDLAVDSTQRWTTYQQGIGRGSELIGISTGFPTIDLATAGLQQTQLITIVATPKVGKSTLAMSIAAHVHGLGLVPYLQSFEMSNQEQEHRHDAIRARVSHSRLVRSTLTVREEKRFRQMLATIEGAHPFILSDSAEGLTISAIQAKIAKYRPQLAIIDGVYLMHDEVSGDRNTPQALTNISRNFKRMAQRNNIPIIITTQALEWKMRGVKLSGDSIGYSSAFFQDSDVILGLEFTDVEKDSDTRRLRVVASRNCGPADVELEWDWDQSLFCESGTVS